MKHIDEIIENGTTVTFTYHKGKNNLSNLMDIMHEEKIKYNRVYSELPTLNDVFLELTGKELRD